jgi:hypothetical protein
MVEQVVQAGVDTALDSDKLLLMLLHILVEVVVALVVQQQVLVDLEL